MSRSHQYFEWIVMLFRLKNVVATYKQAMNFISHDMIDKSTEVYINGVFVKSDEVSYLYCLEQAFTRI